MRHIYICNIYHMSPENQIFAVQLKLGCQKDNVIIYYPQVLVSFSRYQLIS
jgi:hypothetical protein